MKIYHNKHIFEYKWETVTQALWQKYPNPFSPHVVGADILNRYVDSDGNLCTLRLFHKTSTIPQWGRHLINISDTYITETSVVDPKSKIMRVSVKNITLNNFLTVEEIQCFTLHPDNQNWTLVRTEARFFSNLSWGLRTAVERFGYSKFQEHYSKSKKAFSHILASLKNKVSNTAKHAQ